MDPGSEGPAQIELKIKQCSCLSTGVMWPSLPTPDLQRDFAPPEDFKGSFRYCAIVRTSCGGVHRQECSCFSVVLVPLTDYYYNLLAIYERTVNVR